MKLLFINEKVFYRFVEFTSRLITTQLSHEYYKMIALNQKEANTTCEKKVKRLADAFLYLIFQTSQVVDYNHIRTAYYLLTNKKLCEQKLDLIIKNYYIHKDEHAFVQAASMMLILDDISINRKLEFSLLLSNYILIKNNYYPIVLTKSDVPNLRKLIKSKMIGELSNLIYMHEFQTKSSIGVVRQAPNHLSLVDLINKFIEKQSYLMSEFNVKHLFIYGGVAKHKTHENSDIDIIIDFDKEMVNFQKYMIISKLQSYLEELFNQKVDVLDFSYSLKYSEIKEMNNAIKVF